MLRSDTTGICLRKSTLADIRKNDGLEGRDQVEDPFYDSRKNMIQSSGNRKERTDACGSVGIDSLGSGSG